jgi:hypothetical protein
MLLRRSLHPLAPRRNSHYTPAPIGPLERAPSAREADCYVAPMSWLLPNSLLLVAAVAALVPLAFLLRRRVSLPCLAGETFATTLAVIVLVWFG